MRYLFAIIALCASLNLQAQADTIFTLIAEWGSSTQVTDSTFTTSAEHPIDQLGQGFLPTQIQVGYYCLDAYGRRYIITAIGSADFGSSSLTVKELQDNNLGPSGVGLIYRKESDHDRIPVPPGGNTGLAPATLARIHIHNVVNGGNPIDSADWATLYALQDTAQDLRTTIAAVTTGDVTTAQLADSTAALRSDLVEYGDSLTVFVIPTQLTDSLDLFRKAIADSAPTGSADTVDLYSRYVGIYQVDLTSASSPLTLTVQNPIEGGVYTFHFLNASSNDITFPATFYDESATTLGTVTYANPAFITCYFDGGNYYCK